MITRITSLLFLLLTVLSVNAQGVRFESDLTTALEKVKKDNKPLFIEYYNENCSICKTLNPIFEDPVMGNFYNTNFVNYRINTANLKKEDSLYIAQSKLKPESVPYFLFFDVDNTLIHCSGAKADAGYLVNTVGKTALNPEERTANLAKKYASGDKSIRTLYAYSNLVQLYKDERMVNRIANDLYDAFPKDQLDSQKSYTVLKNCVFSIDNGFFTYWVTNIEKLKAFDSEAKVLQNILLKTINSDAKNNWNLAKIKSVKELIEKTELSTNPDAFLWQQEAAVLIKEGREPEAIALFTKMTKDETIAGASYIVNQFLDLVKEKNSFAVIKSKIEALRNVAKDNDDKADLLYTELRYWKKLNNREEVQKLLVKANAFYKANQLDLARLNEFKGN